MRPRVKRLLLSFARKCGLQFLVRDSGWRTQRLLVLCWHGIALEDEHLWRPGLYISAARFRARLERLRDGGYRVLSLAEGIERLRRKELPPRSVALTFDDGFYDFYVMAAPMLAEFGYPVTVYLTTYYVDDQRPVFPLIISYLLWKGGRRLEDGSPFSTPAEAQSASVRLVEQAERDHLSAAEKDQLVRSLAGKLGLDYEDLRRRRLLHLMNAGEVHALHASGRADFEIHTHRHRVPTDPRLLARELRDNQERIEQLTGRRPVHFCYPSGVIRPEMFQALEAAGVESAATCRRGLATARTHRYLLPRLLDASHVDEPTFEGWLSGLLGLQPQRAG